jgi:multidrug efflux system membrane fusion protein
MKYFITAATVLLLSYGCSKPPQKVAPSPPVTVTKPTVRDVDLYQDYVGNVVANISVEVMSQVSGIMTGQYFVEGQEVKQGDLLLTIDSRPYVADLAQAEAVLAQSLATLRYAEETTTRYAKLVQEDFISQLNYDQYVTNVLTGEAQIKQNLAQIDLAKINLGYCSITAPMDCVTGKLLVKVGNYVDANSNTELVLLNQIKPILVDFYIPDRDLPYIQFLQNKGQLSVVAYVNRDKSQPHGGTLTLINNQVSTTAGSILLEATFPNEDKGLWPGQFVDIQVILGKKTGALLIPSEAIQVGQQGHYVYVITPDNTAELKVVKPAQVYDSLTMINEGLTADDMVVVAGQLNLYPGIKVSIQTSAPGSETP